METASAGSPPAPCGQGTLSLAPWGGTLPCGLEQNPADRQCLLVPLVHPESTPSAFSEPGDAGVQPEGFWVDT